MQEADRVHSTPPTNASPLQETNPPPAARAESVDSFSHQPATGQPETGKLTGESGKPAEGLSRRTMLGAIAVLPVVPAAALAIDLPPPDGFERVIENGRIWFKAVNEDPAFALIAAKRAADVAHCEAIDAEDAAATAHEYGSPAVQEAWDRSCDACQIVNEADWRLAKTPPTTLAGVAAVLRFANAIEDGGMEWPGTDTVGAEGWHYQLRATMAQAIETIIRKGGA